MGRADSRHPDGRELRQLPRGSFRRVCKQAVDYMAPEGAANSSASRRKKNPRSGRLLRHADFERVYKQGRRHFSAHMTVFYLRRAEGEGLRVGFTVGRAWGGAVDRNRMKRRLRESVRLMRPANEPPADVVINPKKSLQSAEFSALLTEVGRAFEVIIQKLAEKPRTRE